MSTTVNHLPYTLLPSGTNTHLKDSKYLFCALFLKKIAQNQEASRLSIDMVFTKSQLEIMFISTLTAKTLSILGCTMNFITAIVLKKIQSNFLKIVLIISFMDIIYSGFALWKDLFPISASFCRVIDGFARFGFFGSIAWTCCFSHYLLTCLQDGTYDHLEKLFKRYALFSTLFSVVGAIFVSMTSEYKMNKIGSCLRQTRVGSYNWPNLVGIELPSIFTIIFCAYHYWKAYRRIKKITKTSHTELLLYPVMIIICLLPFVTLSIRNQIFDSQQFVWTLISNTMGFLQGFLNALVFGTYRRVTQLMCGRCSKVKDKKETLIAIHGTNVYGSVGNDRSESISLNFQSKGEKGNADLDTGD